MRAAWYPVRKEGRGTPSPARQYDSEIERGGVTITVNLSVSDHETLAKASIKKMRQTGEDVTRDRVISEAIQAYAKGLSAAE